MIEITLDDGTVMNYEVLANFYLEKTNKNYIVYTDGKYDGEELNIYAVNCGSNHDKIEYVTSKDEWAFIAEKLTELGFKGVNYGRK